MNDPVLFPYQVLGAHWLASHRAAILGDEMGIGKSATAITAADFINAKKILVIGPAISRIMWKREFDKFSKTSRTLKIIETTDDCRDIPTHSLVVSSYTLAADNPTSFFSDFDLIILDECHFLKNPTTKRTLNILGKEGIIHGQSKEATVWALSGTPAPNHAGELWPLLRSFGATSQQYDDFIQRFCNSFKSSYGQIIRGTKKAKIPELKQIISKVLLRRTKVDVNLQLPEIFYQYLDIEGKNIDNDLELDPFFIKWVFPTDKRDELHKLLQSQIAIIEKTLTGNNALEMLSGLAKSISTLRMYTGIQKTAVLAPMIREELEHNLYDKIVIFGVHQSVIEGFRRELKEFNPVTLYGGTNAEKAQKNIDSFQTKDHCRVFIGNIQACGTAVTLTAAHNVLFAEQSFTPGDNAQAAKRCHRIGQTQPVTVRVASLNNSIDQKINNILKNKIEELTLLFDGDKQSPLLSELV